MNHLRLDSKAIELKESFDYPNKKVMRKTKGKLDPGRMTSSLPLLTPEQIMLSLKETKDIQQSFYNDLSLVRIMNAVK